MQTPYDADYFLRGQETGISNYTDYRWLEEPTMALAERVVEVMGIKRNESFLDYGCARGYLVKALRRDGFNAYGYDISQWAIENCDPAVKDYVSLAPPKDRWDHIWMKDVAEHMEPGEFEYAVGKLAELTEKSMMIIVPLADWGGDAYVRKEDNLDKTHIIRWSLETWMAAVFNRVSEKFIVTGSWHIPGLKPTSLSCPYSCGFITLRRV